MGLEALTAKIKHPFCVCGHSFWTHWVPGSFSDACDRTGCRCGKYVAEEQRDQ